jgi:Predicted signal transduction protein with a C-terminal ATPase domain
MRLWRKSDFHSIRFKIIIGLLIVVTPILFLLIYNNLYSIQLVRNQVAQSNKNMLHLYMGLIDKELEGIDDYLFRFATEETGFLYLERSEADDPDLYNLAKYQLYQQLYSVAGSASLDYYFLYSPANRDLVLAPKNQSAESRNLDRIRQRLSQAVENQRMNPTFRYWKWSSLELEGKAYLIRLFKSGNVYVGALVNYDRVMSALDELDLGATGLAVMLDRNEQPMEGEEWIAARHINVLSLQENYRMTGEAERFMVIQEQSGRGDFVLAAILNDRSIIEKLPYKRRMIVLIALGTGVVLLGAWLFLRRIVLIPVYRLMVAMRRIREGRLDTRMDVESTSSEFELMNESFNSMASQIERLKIDIYEEQLLTKRAELKHLQLQINPHFYMNSLNTFYYLAEDNKSEVIKELSLSLIRYFRFMFRGHSDFVSVRDEIAHVRNYLRIQAFRFPEQMKYEITAEEELLEARIPPLLVQTFVENAIKHAVTLDQPVTIFVMIRRLTDADGESMLVRIYDDGGGFPQEVIRKFREGSNLLTEAGERIGIWNAKQRLSLLYAGRASMAISNSPGADIRIQLPIRAE